jgi:nucleotide-binding universal stress UspA family protein
MTPPVIVALDPLRPDHAHDALVLAGSLATALEAPLHAVHVFAPGQGDITQQRRAHERSMIELVDRAGLAAEATAYPGLSAARVLHHLCDLEHASCIVIGSGQDGRPGRSSLGAVAEALLHGSMVPVVVVPAGYGSPARGLAHIGVGYGGTPESDAALAFARSLTESVGGRLSVVVAEEPSSGPAAAVAARRLQRAMEPGPYDAVEITTGGDPATALIRASAAMDLLIVGSRSYGPLRAVLLGAVSRRLLGGARCPVMVVPRIADAAHEVALVGGMDASLDAPV